MQVGIAISWHTHQAIEQRQVWLVEKKYWDKKSRKYELGGMLEVVIQLVQYSTKLKLVVFDSTCSY